MQRRTGGPLTALALMWVLEIVDFVLPGTPLDFFGIRPRTLAGLPGILCAPFLHGGFPHLITNSISFLILGLLVTARRASDFGSVFAWAALIGGAGTWIFGLPNSIHIGASGVIFGFFGFLLTRGFFERSAGAVFLSIVAGVVYGGMLWSLIPVQYGISWSGHFFGFVGGIVAARSLPRVR